MRARDGAIYIASRVVPGAIGFAATMSLTWLLSPEEFGVYGMGLATVVLGTNIVFDWLLVSLQRWYPGREADPVFMPTLLAMFAGACILSASLLGLATLSGALDGHRGRAWLILLGVWAYAWFEFATKIQLGRSRAARYFWMNVARNCLMLVACTIVGYLTRSADAVLASAFAAMLIAGCMYLRDGSIRLRRTFDAALARSFAVYAAPVGLGMALFGLNDSATRIVLGWLAGPTAVAEYAVVAILVQNSVGLVSAGLGPPAVVSAVRAMASGHAAVRDQLERNFTFLFGLLLPAGVGLVLIAPDLADLVAPPRYHDVVRQLAPWLAVASVLAGMRSNYVEPAFQLGNRTGLGAQVTAAGAAVNLALNFLLVPHWGALGSAAALTAAAAVSLAHGIYLSSRAYPLPLPARDAWQIVAATCLMSLAVILLQPIAGITGLLLRILVAVAVYGATLAAFDTRGIRRAFS
ncbi:oligosaccharide flippase family protein [Paracraurococcus lichenis]|uniref:Oligosaccharide flippase family protein n=1 Tax=Paracraurococcus lichenis TaxID=3064888 RepID=A0ABT9E8R5_9PROT|nr:oligosaccharide flippase family protein [Paracraurococcus sp. LOR1-02]MDO9712570.1 oligosaccharide flippase family protein [Paracraurococcus sp. LOR1-02]